MNNYTDISRLKTINPAGKYGPGLTACFTGHRPNKLHGYVRTAYEPLIRYMTGLLSDLAMNGVAAFISGGAQGFDQLAFTAVDRMKSQTASAAGVQNIVYVPFKGQDGIWPKESLFGRDDYAAMLRAADKAVILSEKPADKYGVIRALHGRNHAMVDDSDFVIALWAEGPALDINGRGGTAECIRYARSKNKPVLVVYYDTVHPERTYSRWM